MSKFNHVRSLCWVIATVLLGVLSPAHATLSAQESVKPDADLFNFYQAVQSGAGRVAEINDRQAELIKSLVAKETLNKTCAECHKVDQNRSSLLSQLQVNAEVCPFVAGQKTNLIFGGSMNVSTLGIEVRDPQQELFGAIFLPISEAHRAQLGIGEGRGILVESLRSDGPSAKAGLKPFDVLLTLGDKPLTSADDLAQHLKGAGDGPVTLNLLRGGQQISLPVRPIIRVTLGPVDEEKKEYFIGVQLSALEEALRSQLAIPDGQGVLITDVVTGSPAESAGIKVHDIVLEFGGVAIDRVEKLAAQVQAAQEQPQTMKLLRGGKPIEIKVKGALRKGHDVQGMIERDISIRFLDLSESRKAAEDALRIFPPEAVRYLGVSENRKAALDALMERVRRDQAEPSEREAQRKLNQEPQTEQKVEEMRQEIHSILKSLHDEKVWSEKKRDELQTEIQSLHQIIEQLKASPPAKK